MQENRKETAPEVPVQEQLKDYKCPKCSKSVKSFMNFCPYCQERLKESEYNPFKINRY